MKKYIATALCAIVLFCLGLTSASAAGEPASQDKTTLKGYVIGSDDNSPLAGVVIFDKNNKSILTTTNAKGEYSLTIPSTTETVVFEMMGYDTKEIKVSDKFLFSLVTMIVQSSALDGVVVVGFGTQKKESVVGAVQAIKPDNLITTSSNLTTAFAGNIPGLIATQSSGEPGYDNVTFHIRGISTFGANSGALIVLDGVEITSSMLANISQESIESMSILKDATATALYGSRGANGVIIVTTKEGRNSEKINVNISIDNTVSMPTSIQDIADGVTYMEAYNEARYNDARAAGAEYIPFYSKEKIEGTRAGLNPYVYPDNDWYSLLFKDMAMNQRVNLSVRGGGKKVNYFLNASIFNENGILRKPEHSILDIQMNNKKYLFQSNVSAQVTNTTKVAMKLNMQIQYNTTPYESTGDLFYWVMRANPVRFPAVLPAQDGDTFIRFGNNTSWDTGATDLNPYARMASGYKERYYSYMTAVASIDQDLHMITKGLTLKGIVSFYNYSYAATNRSVIPYYYRVDDAYSIDPSGDYLYTTSTIGDEGSTYLTNTVSHDGYHEWSLQGSANYARTFGKHDVSADLVYHMKEKVYNATSSDEYKLLPYREQGLAGRITYNYAKKYFIEGNFGYNGSENFMAGKRFGFFPSVAVGWSISNEKFFAPAKQAVSNLKLRASFGQVGNDALSVRFPYITAVSMGGRGYYFGSGFTNVGAGYVDTYGNEDATWEVADKYNVGLDIEFFKALSISVDGFYEYRRNIFLQRNSLSATAGLGVTVPYANLGEVSNRGFDASVQYNKSLSKDLTLTLRGTMTYAHNSVEAMDEPSYEGSPNLSKIGYPINASYVLVADGIFTSQEQIDESPVQEFGSYSVGDIKYKDVNGDNKVNANDYTWTETPTRPELQYGLGGTVHYKKWDFTAMFQGSGNYKLLMSNHHPFCTTSNFGFNVSKYIVDDHWSWDNNNSEANYPRLTSVSSTNNTQASTFYLYKGNFLRLKSVELGFSPMESLRIYISGSNLFTITPFKYWDPELGSGNGLKYPLQRTVRIGVNYKF